MGEKIKDITVLKLHDMDVAIELNDGSASTREYKTIHVQSERFRLQLKESQYLQIAAAVSVAAKKIMQYKEIKDE